MYKDQSFKGINLIFTTTGIPPTLSNAVKLEQVHLFNKPFYQNVIRNVPINRKNRKDQKNHKNHKYPNGPKLTTVIPFGLYCYGHILQRNRNINKPKLAEIIKKILSTHSNNSKKLRIFLMVRHCRARENSIVKWLPIDIISVIANVYIEDEIGQEYKNIFTEMI